jgi:hypothetical protein
MFKRGKTYQNVKLAKTGIQEICQLSDAGSIRAVQLMKNYICVDQLLDLLDSRRSPRLVLLERP